MSIDWLRGFCDPTRSAYRDPVAVELDDDRYVCATDGDFAIAVRSDEPARDASPALCQALLRELTRAPNGAIRVADLARIEGDTFCIGDWPFDARKLVRALPHLRGDVAEVRVTGRDFPALIIGDGWRVAIRPAYPRTAPKTKLRPFFVLDPRGGTDPRVAEREAAPAHAEGGPKACDKRPATGGRCAEGRLP